jgi:translation initiation factor IF-2
MTKKNKDYKVLSEKEIEKCVEEFREWMKTQENFPQDIESTLIVRYLNIFHYQKDRAQRLFKNALEYRAKHPKLFVNRHPRSPAMMKVIDQL